MRNQKNVAIRWAWWIIVIAIVGSMIEGQGREDYDYWASLSREATSLQTVDAPLTSTPGVGPEISGPGMQTERVEEVACRPVMTCPETDMRRQINTAVRQAVNDFKDEAKGEMVAAVETVRPCDQRKCPEAEERPKPKCPKRRKCPKLPQPRSNVTLANPMATWMQANEDRLGGQLYGL